MQYTGVVIAKDTRLAEDAADHAMGTVLSLLDQYPARSEDDRALIGDIRADLTRERSRIAAAAAATAGGAGARQRAAICREIIRNEEVAYRMSDRTDMNDILMAAESRGTVAGLLAALCIMHGWPLSESDVEGRADQLVRRYTDTQRAEAP